MLRPKRCSRNLQRICDINSDSIISKQEWRTCVGLEQNSKLTMDSKSTTFVH